MSPLIKGVPGLNLPSLGGGAVATDGPRTLPINICDLPGTI